MVHKTPYFHKLEVHKNLTLSNHTSIKENQTDLEKKKKNETLPAFFVGSANPVSKRSRWLSYWVFGFSIFT